MFKIILAFVLVLAGTAICADTATWPKDTVVLEAPAGALPADQQLIDKCDSVITYWADRYSDEWYFHMEQCVYLDPDYLTTEEEPYI